MNLKKAKAIRGLVKQLVKKEVLKGSWVEYGKVDHPTARAIRLSTEKNHTVTPTVVVMPMSPRGIYRRMKKNGPTAVLAGLK